MGITIADTLTLDSGLTVANAYGAISENSITIRKNDTNSFIIRSVGQIWINQNSKNNKESIQKVNIEKYINISEISSNLYSLLYTQWKTQYSSVSDVL